MGSSPRIQLSHGRITRTRVPECQFAFGGARPVIVAAADLAAFAALVAALVTARTGIVPNVRSQATGERGLGPRRSRDSLIHFHANHAATVSAVSANPIVSKLPSPFA